ncbi:hypothetical protein A5663_08680 [Mycobacterium sp. E740]|nr:hypothetical protein A5663_08680 [Mycobacterium sp. E740]
MAAGALWPLDGSTGLDVGSSPMPVGALWPLDGSTGLLLEPVGALELLTDPGVEPVESSVPAPVPVPPACFDGLSVFDGLSFLDFDDETLLALVSFCDAGFDFPLLGDLFLPALFAALLSEGLLALPPDDESADDGPSA